MLVIRQEIFKLSKEFRECMLNEVTTDFKYIEVNTNNGIFVALCNNDITPKDAVERTIRELGCKATKNNVSTIKKCVNENEWLNIKTPTKIRVKVYKKSQLTDKVYYYLCSEPIITFSLKEIATKCNSILQMYNEVGITFQDELYSKDRNGNRKYKSYDEFLQSQNLKSAMELTNLMLVAVKNKVNFLDIVGYFRNSNSKFFADYMESLEYTRNYNKQIKIVHTFIDDFTMEYPFIFGSVGLLAEVLSIYAQIYK